MKIFTKLVSVFLLVAIGSLFFFSCAEKEKCTPMVSFLETALQQAGENRVELEKVFLHTLRNLILKDTVLLLRS